MLDDVTAVKTSYYWRVTTGNSGNKSCWRFTDALPFVEAIIEAWSPISVFVLKPFRVRAIAFQPYEVFAINILG